MGRDQLSSPAVSDRAHPSPREAAHPAPGAATHVCRGSWNRIRRTRATAILLGRPRRTAVRSTPVRRSRSGSEGRADLDIAAVERGISTDEGGYLWRAQPRLWDNEISWGWYAADDQAVRSKGTLYLVVHPHGHQMRGRWEGWPVTTGPCRVGSPPSHELRMLPRHSSTNWLGRRIRDRHRTVRGRDHSTRSRLGLYIHTRPRLGPTAV